MQSAELDNVVGEAFRLPQMQSVGEGLAPPALHNNEDVMDKSKMCTGGVLPPVTV